MTSKATKRKHVMREVLYDFILPEGRQQIVKVIDSCGNNLHKVVTAQNEEFLVSMPTKFRQNIWIKRGDFILVTPIDEGDKVKAEITAILYKEQIKFIKENSKWPEEFLTDKDRSNSPDTDMFPPSDDDSDGTEEEADDLFVGAGNPNRPRVVRNDTSDSDSSDDDDDK